MAVPGITATPALNWPNISLPVIATAEGSFVRVLLVLVAAELIVMAEAIYAGCLLADWVGGLISF